VKAGKVILIVGSSCSGKTTLAKALQAEAAEHFLHLSLDAVFAMVSERWGGSGPFCHDGFSYQPKETDETIGYGPLGRIVLAGMHRAAKSFADAGVNVVIDDMLLDENVLHDWTEALQGLEVMLVRTTAPSSMLSSREALRKRSRGLALGSVEANSGFAVDIEIDTSRVSPQQGAQRILAALANPSAEYRRV
jgi:chloramphenicol 3-O phosphotransferase